MNSLKNKLGRKLFQARVDAGLSQLAVSQAGIVSQSHLSKIENGDLLINIFTLVRLSQLYGKNIEYFTNDLIE